MQPGIAIELLFFGKVNPAPALACWEWASASGKARYGQFRVGGRVVQAHRWSYEHFVGEIPEGLVIDHLCMNKPCVNPWHLDAVSQQVNSKRGMATVSKTEAVRADLRRRIVAGEFGHALPLQRELQRQYGASSHVLSTALGRLSTEGLVTRRGDRGRWALAA